MVAPNGDNATLEQLRSLEERKPAREVARRHELREIKLALQDVTAALKTQNEILLSLSREFREDFFLDSGGQVRPTRNKPPSTHKRVIPSRKWS